MQRPIKISSSAAAHFVSPLLMNIYTGRAARVRVCLCGSHTYAFGLGKCTWPSIKPSLYRTAIICALIESNWVAEHARSQQNGIHTAHTSVSAPHDLPIASSSPPPRQLWAMHPQKSTLCAWKYLSAATKYANIPTQLFDKAKWVFFYISSCVFKNYHLRIFLDKILKDRTKIYILFVF